MSRIEKIIVLSAAIGLLIGCAAGPKTTFHPVSTYQSVKSISSQNVVRITKINISGDLKDKSGDPVPPLIAGFSKINDTVSLVTDKKEHTYFDCDLILDIATKRALAAGDYYKTVPGVSLLSMYGPGINFEWTVTVNYLFNNIDGQPIDKGSFAIEGADKYSPGAGANYLSFYIGIGAIVAGYPDAEAGKVVSDFLMRAVGEEISKRLNADPVRSYLAKREKQRDGMDVKTYVEFIEKKKRLEKERAVAKTERLKGLEVNLKRNQFADIKSRTVMVLGIGVSKYQSTEIPTLKYADSDSRRIVSYFKNRYKLSNDRAMLLINEEATAIKISRFITNNAMKLLDKNDTFILYFGGHGAPDVDSTSKDDDGLKKYLLLYDSDFNSLPMTALSLNNLAMLLEKLPCKRIIILLDSCFAGTAGMQTLSKLKGVRISDRSYKNITELSGEGRVILAASSENQVSHEDGNLQAGVFTHYLLEGLNGKADLKGDGDINILELYEYVHREVLRYTQNKQAPVFRGTLDANIIF